MSHSPSATAPPSKYQAIFDEALKTYKKKTGKDLKSDPLLRTLEACQSPIDTLSELRRQIPGFDQSENSDNNLTNWIDPVVSVLYVFAQTIGGAVGLVSNPGAVIFTAISSLLSIVMAVRAVKSTITDLFESIKGFFTRLKIYVQLPPTEEITEIIVDVMVHVLHILALLTKEIKQGNTKRFVKKLVGRSDLEDALRRFEKLTLEESRMVNAQGLKVTYDVDAGVKVAINKVDAVLDRGENIRVELHQVARGVSDLAKDASDEKRNQMRQDFANWLSPADPFINFNTANEVHYEGTAEWFTQSIIFKNWKESGSLLWIHGKPGSGKSVLSSSIIQDINGICDAGTGHLAFFFFDFKDAVKQNARALLSSIVVQLGNRSVGFSDVLFSFYSAHQDGKQQPSISSLKQCLEDMLEVREELPIYLIIDAIDECPNTTGVPSSRDQVMSLLERLVKLELPNLHICVTSRPEADIRTYLESLTPTSNSISLHDESGQKQDIIDYVTSVVRSDRNMRRWREADKELVINTLTEKAAGMFRWVFCQLETLRPCLPSSVPGILAELPETLDATYERILQEIPKPNRAHAHRLLQCLTAAFRPLTVEELAEVLVFDFSVAGGIPKLNQDHRWEDQEQAVLSACSSLISIVKDEDSRRVQFSHFSVKEFLVSDRLVTSEMAGLDFHHIDLETAHALMARTCLGVVLQLDDTMDKKTIWSYPLAKYAGAFLGKHTEAGNVLSQISDEVDDLFDPDKPYFKTWIWLWNNCYDVGPEELDYGKKLEQILDDSNSTQSSSDQSSTEHLFPKMPSIPSLHYAAMCENSCFTRHLILKHAHDLNASDMFGKTPLHVAAAASVFETTGLLVEHGADVNARDNRGYTPLHYAMTFDKESEDDRVCSVRFLLEHGADAEAQNDRGTTPLHVAAFNYTPSRNIVQILVENVKNSNLRDDQGQTALHKASRCGHTDIIGILLDHGADVNAQDNSGSTPLYLAISKVQLPAAELLLKRGANIDLRNSNKHQTALHLASQRGYIDIMQCLLENGANVGAPDDDGSTPLHLASSNWGSELELLLKYGANIDTRNKKGQTALHIASQHDDPHILRCLLDNGANVGAPDDDGSTPLHLASSHSESWASDILLKYGANIDARNNNGQTALHLTSQHRRLNLIRFLLRNGANVDAQDNDGLTLLHLIISKVPMGSDDSDSDDSGSELPGSHSEVIELLLDHGASGHKENNQGQTPFQLAEMRGLRKITELLSTHIQSEQTV